jgi:IS30 family transposase
MLKLEFTKQEVDEIKSKIYLSEIQERIFEYRLKEYSITKMAMLENVSESTITRELKKLRKKIIKII